MANPRVPFGVDGLAMLFYLWLLIIGARGALLSRRHLVLESITLRH